ncbi:MAG: hydrogenase maturation nickel metallochaperone HypA [Nocardioides sp.]|nr:hydrogenase maturation nickel metallochaperone HypA [Nocardioides sp.]
MHEIGLCEGLVPGAVEGAAGRPVRSVRIRAGVLQRIVPESMQLAWQMVADGTVAQDALVELDVVPVTLTCRGCGATTQSEDPYARCSACSGVDLDTSGGDELMLVSLELGG